MRKKYHCIMSHYPMDEPVLIPMVVPNRPKEHGEYMVDINNDFWEATIMCTPAEFDEWVACHKWGWNMVMVVDIK